VVPVFFFVFACCGVCRIVHDESRFLFRKDHAEK
jgi:hypothetical protein